MVNQEATVKIKLNNQEAQDQLVELQNEMKRFIQLKKEAQAKGDVAGYAQWDKELKKAGRTAKKLAEEYKDVEQVLKNLSGVSLNELTSTKTVLLKKVKDLKQGTHEWIEENKKLRQVENQIAGVKQQMGLVQSPLQKVIGLAKGLLPAFGFAAIFTAIIRTGKELFSLTSQIQGETIRSVTVFGDQLGYVEAQADKVAKKMGVTNREFVSMAANTADLLIPLDFTREAAAKMSTQVQSLAGALDEWTAGKYGVAEVSNILTKAMLGEMEQLKGLGIAIRQDSKEYTDLVKQKEAIAGTTNAQARAMATLELLYKKSADAQNAYLLEGNQLLRFQKAASLLFKEFKENIATGFAETMKSSTELFTEQQKKVSLLEQNLIPLIDRYEVLSNKSIPLTSDEQTELNSLIQQIASITPGAITELDKYGKALGISADTARTLVEEQKKMLLVKNSEEIAAQEKELKKLNKEFEREVANKKMLVSSSKDQWAADAPGFYDERIAKSDAEIERLKQLIEGRQNYVKVLKGESLITPPPPPDDSAPTSLFQIQEKLLDQAKKMPETTEEEISAKNREIAAIETKIKKLKELGVENSKAEKDKAYTSNELSGTKATNEIKKQLLEKQITEEQANEALLAVEIEFLEKKLALQVKYGDDYSTTEAAILDKRLQAAKEHDKKSADEKKKSNDKTLKDLDNKENDELNVIKKQLADKQITEEDAQRLLLEKEIEFLNKRIFLKKQWGEDTADLEGKVLDKTNQIAENALKGDEDRLKRLNEIRRQYEDEDVLMAREKADALAEIDALYESGAIKSWEDYQRLKTAITKKYELSRAEITVKWLEQVAALLQASSNFFSALKDDELSKAEGNAEKQKEIKKKYADKEFALAAAEIIVSTAVAAINAFRSLSIIPVVGPALGAAAAIAVGITGAAQLVKANTARQEAKSLADGGFAGNTGPGSKYTKKQLVQLHAEEYVTPMEGTQNPSVRQFLDIFEIARRNGSLARLNTAQILQAIPARGMATGGYGSAGSRTSEPGTGNQQQVTVSTDPAILKKFDELAAAFENLKIYASIEDIRKADRNYTEIQNTRGM